MKTYKLLSNDDSVYEVKMINTSFP